MNMRKATREEYEKQRKQIHKIVKRALKAEKIRKAQLELQERKAAFDAAVASQREEDEVNPIFLSGVGEVRVTIVVTVDEILINDIDQACDYCDQIY